MYGQPKSAREGLKPLVRFLMLSEVLLARFILLFCAIAKTTSFKSESPTTTSVEYMKARPPVRFVFVYVFLLQISFLVKLFFQKDRK